MKNQFSSEPGLFLARARKPQLPSRIGGLAGWLVARFGLRSQRRPALVVRERITLAPRQTLSLIEADGRRFLLATSPEGTPAFCALDERSPRPSVKIRGARTSW